MITILFSIINNWFEQWIEKEHKKIKQKKRKQNFEKQLNSYKEFRDREIDKIIKNAGKEDYDIIDS